MNDLKRLRERRGLSLAQLGKLCGDRSRAQMWALENEVTKMPNLKTAYEIAKAFRVSVYKIWPDTTEIEVEKVTIRRVKRAR